MKANVNQAFGMENYTGQAMKQMEDMMSMGQQASDAWMKSGSILAKCAEEMMKTCVNRAQSANEKNANAWKALMACKTVNEFTDTQNKLAQQGFEEAINTTAEMSEITVKFMMDAFEPINKQMSAAMKKANDAVAA